MEILLVILLVVVIAALAFAATQARRQRRAIAADHLERGTSSPLPRRSRAARRHPMADAVAEHARVTDPRDVVAAERRLQAQAGRAASDLQADARRDEHARANEQLANADADGDPPVDGHTATDPRYDERPAGNPADPRYDGRSR